MVINVEHDAHLQELLSKHPKCVLDFWASWCGPCRKLSAMLEDAEMWPLPVLKINVDSLPDIASQYSVRALPTLIGISDHGIVSRKSGFATPEDVLTFMNEFS